MLVGAVVFYPALLLVATFGAYPVEWGPVLTLVRVRAKLLGMLLVLNILWWHFRCISVLLEERVQAWAAFVLFDRSGQLLLGAGALVILLRRRVQTGCVLLLLLLQILQRSVLSASG